MRIKIACANNIFFDISNANFTIQALSLATIAAGAAPTEPSTNGCFIVTLSQPAPTGGMTVTYSVATGGSAATPGVDYVALRAVWSFRLARALPIYPWSCSTTVSTIPARPWALC